MAELNTDEALQLESPCVRMCTLDSDDICIGCFRNIDEICAWGSATNRQRQEILDNAARRSRQRSDD